MTTFAPALLNPQDLRRALKQQQFQALQPNQLHLKLQTFPRLAQPRRSMPLRKLRMIRMALLGMNAL